MKKELEKKLLKEITEILNSEEYEDEDGIWILCPDCHHFVHKMEWRWHGFPYPQFLTQECIALYKNGTNIQLLIEKDAVKLYGSDVVEAVRTAARKAGVFYDFVETL